MIKRLFTNFYFRFRKENDLSDFTWAFCEASELFKGFFLEFFFPNTTFNNIKSFAREVSKDDSRADFVIDNDGVIYVIECKINDKNHHFEQYVNTYCIPNERLGYITNYHCRKEGFEVKRWGEFCEFIESKLTEDSKEKEHIEGYIEYVRNVCGIIKIKTMNFNGLQSLYHFNIALRSVLNRETDKFALSFYSFDFKESYYGHKFKVESTHKDIIWLSFGVWFNSEKPTITLGVWKKDGWGQPFCKVIEQRKTHNQVYAGQSYWEDSSYYFEGTDKFDMEFSTADTPEQQIATLCKFVDEVVNFYLE